MRRAEVKKTLLEAGLAPGKDRGQNFLVSDAIARQIADACELSQDDTVIEPGPGLGALTTHLARRARRVIACEIDRGIIRHHDETGELAANVQLLHQDMLALNFQQLARETGAPLILAGNLPYAISTPFLTLLAENSHFLDRAVFMLQKEAAERFLAPPGSKAYGAPSILIRARATLQRLFHVGPEHFYPRPKVDSTVMSFRFLPPPATVSEMTADEWRLFRSIVRRAFQSRRKTMTNALKQLAPGFPAQDDPQFFAAALAAAGLSPQIRPDQVTIDGYVRLTKELFNRL